MKKEDKGIIKRPFPHWNLWIWSRYNKKNAERLLNEHSNDKGLKDLILFLEQVYIGRIVPNKLFREGNSVRATLLCQEKIVKSEVNESRFLKYTTNLPNKKLSNHNRVLIPILENEENSLAIELPLWCEKFMHNGKWITVTGHIDLLQYHPNEEMVYIWDYKPDFSIDKPHIVSEQVKFYKLLLNQLIWLELDRIVCGWFNNSHEFILRD